MKRTLLTLAAGVAIGAVTVAAPALGSHHATKRFITVGVGDNITIPTLDLFCSVEGHDPDGHVTGPVIYCDRNSVSGRSWGVFVSRRWIKVANPTYYVYQHARLP
jgi:hypothetical protein